MPGAIVAHHRHMSDTALVDAIQSVLAGTAFDRAQGGDAGCGTYLTWCTPTRTFRERHPGVPEALDLEHPDGCTDLIVAVDRDGRLERASLEMLELAPDLVGHPIEDVLPELVERLRRLLSSS